MAQSMDARQWRVVELNGGRVEDGLGRLLRLPFGKKAYANAQIDDYGGPGGDFIHRPGVILTLRARFSHTTDSLEGTAGFGFWNAPYGDPTRSRPALPQAIWFFFASPPNDLPFAPGSPGRGWFAATLDASTVTSLAMIPLAPVVLALNQFSASRAFVWPAVLRNLGIHAAPLNVDLTRWHAYSLEWWADGARFKVDGREILETSRAPRGPLGFVCWLDNQYLVLTPRGRIRAGVLSTRHDQWLEIEDLAIRDD